MARTRRHRSGTTLQVEGEDWLEQEGGVDWRDPRRRRRRSRPEAHVLATGVVADGDVFGEFDEAPRRIRRERSAFTRVTIPNVFRRRWVAALTVVGLVAVAGVAIALSVSGGGSAKSPTTATPAPAPAAPATPATPAPSVATPAPARAAGTSAVAPALKVVVPKGTQLTVGSRGATVVTLQKALTRLKLDVGKPDGIFGPTTKAAVVRFQTTHGLSPDGIVGPATAAKLNAALAAAS